MIEINHSILEKIREIALKHDLRMVILFGSQAKKKAKAGSDVDIAVLGVKEIPFGELAELNNEFAEVFEIQNVDVKSLHRTDPLFRFQATREGILLFGRKRDFDSFRAFAFRDYNDSRDLLRLKEVIISKRLQRLSVS